MTTDNKNEFSFDELSEPVKKKDQGDMDTFSFGEIPEPDEKSDKNDTDDFFFGELSEPVKRSDQGETDVFSFSEAPGPAEKIDKGDRGDFSFGEIPEPVKKSDQGDTDDFFFGELPEPVNKSDQDDVDAFSFGEIPEAAKKTDQCKADDFSFGELPGPVEKSDQGDTELRRFDVTECQEFLPFTCQKCAAKNDVGYYQIQDGGLTTKCSSCQASIEIVRDSCAKRASQLSKELYCVKCGHLLDHRILCPSCGLLYPDYFVAINHEEARRQARNRRAARFRQTFTDLGASIRSIATPRLSKEEREAYTPKRHGGAAIKKTAVLSKNLRIALISLVVIVALAASGFAYYHQYKAEQAFVKNYVRALYGIKIGTEGSVTACAKISEEWKATAESRMNFIPRVNADNDTKEDKIKYEVDKLMQKLQKPPSKYSQANAKLVELNNIYVNLYSLKSSPRGTLDNFNSSVDKGDKAFKQAAQELKANLPKRLSKELEAGKLRYRGLAGL